MNKFKDTVVELKDAHNTEQFLDANAEADALLEEHPENILYEFGFPQTIEHIASVDEVKAKLRSNASERLKNAIQPRRGKSYDYKDRKRKIDDAIRLLIKNAGADPDHQTLCLIAEAYLRRSNFILPREKRIPEEKISLVRKGLSYSCKAVHKKPDDLHSWKVMGLLYMELETLAEETGRKHLLTDWELSVGLNKTLIIEKVFSIPSEIKDIDDARLALAYAETFPPKAVVLKLLDDFKTEKEPEWNLLRARCYLLLENLTGLESELIELRDKLKSIFFADPIWKDTVVFISKLKHMECPKWQEFALNTWRTCRTIEKEILSPFSLRWYWSGMRDLYDLAFDAETDTAQRAIIADSVKGRVPLRWKSMKELAGDDDSLGDLYEVFASAYAKTYISNLDDVKKNLAKLNWKKGKRTDSHKDIEAEAKPGWRVVHLYISRMDQMGYALVCDTAGKPCADPIPFKYKGLFNAYVTWQKSYLRKGINANAETIALCRSIGKEMGFLFNKEIIPDGNAVLFIPHEFLHKLPLHGAIKDGTDELFLKQHRCHYLPSWEEFNKPQTVSSSGAMQILLKSNEFPNPFEKIPTVQVIDDFQSVNDKTEFFYVACHGEADPVNPFQSRLKLNKKDETFLDILKLDKDLSGSQILLGACETELVPPLDDALDEHISLANILLIKGAAGIVGTMWEVDYRDADNLAVVLYENRKNMSESLWNWQKSRLDNLDNLYHAVAWRYIGTYDG